MPGYRTGSFDAPKDLDKTTTPDNSAVFIPMTPPANFSPMPDTDLLAWYDASTVALGNGAPVTAWPDASNHGNDLFTSAFGAVNPTCVVAGQNGLNTVSFSGNQGLQGPPFFSAFPPTRPFSLIFAAKPLTGFTFIFFSYGSGTDTPPRFVALEPTCPGASGFFALMQKDASNKLVQMTWARSPEFFPDGSWSVVSFVWDGLLHLDDESATPVSAAALPPFYQGKPNSGLWTVNGARLRSLGNAVGSVVGDVHNWTPIASPTMLGSSRNGSSGFKGQLGELLFYQKALNDNARVLVEQYLHRKWNF